MLYCIQSVEKLKYINSIQSISDVTMTADKEPRLKIDIKGTLIANILFLLVALAMIDLVYFAVAGSITALIYIVIKIKKIGGKEKNVE